VQGKSFVPLMSDPSMNWKQAAFSRYHGGESVKTDRYRYTEWKTGAHMLYDHEKDPAENVNIADHPECKTVVEQMRKLLQEHRNSL
jgi:iduronate 2-sulfatase